MQWKVSEADVERIITTQFFNTDRTEVAPWSDVVRKDIQRDLRFAAHCQIPVGDSDGQRRKDPGSRVGRFSIPEHPA